MKQLFARALGLALVASVAAIAAAAAPGCGPACLDDRCSLTPTKPQVTRFDYTNPTAADEAGDEATPAAGSASPQVATAGSAAPAGTGSAAAAAVPPPPPPPPPPSNGTANGHGTTNGSAAPAGSAAPPPPPPAGSSTWAPLNDSFKMYVASKANLPAGTTVKLEFVKLPAKTPFVVMLSTKAAAGNPSSEAVWNECPEGTIVCDGRGVKSHTTRQAGVVLIQAGVNWAVTNVVDDGRGALVTWTNNLSREVLMLRLTT